MNLGTRIVLTALLAAAGPALAQGPVAPPGPPVPPPPPTVVFRTGGMFAGLSLQGQAIMREAVRQRRSPKEAEALRAARQRVLALIAADRLDIAAIRRAQAEERRIVMEGHARQQEALLDAYRKLSPADRKAFAEGMRRREARMDEHVRTMRSRIERMNRIEEEVRERVNRRLRELGIPPAPGDRI